MKFWARLGQNLNNWWCVKNALDQSGLNFNLMAAPVNIVKTTQNLAEFKFNLVLSYFFGEQHYMNTFSFGEPG